MNSFLSFFNTCEKLLPMVKAIQEQGGVSYVVGGTVRDLVLGRGIKDIDIEVHGISLNSLEETLKKFGVVKLVGKKFGVLRLHGFDVDWSLPRRDSCGRKPTVEIDPHMTIEQAAKRRDLTMNAMAIDLNYVAQNFETISKNFDQKLSEEESFKNIGLEIIDPYDGLKDLQEKKLRMVDEALFLEDPLRFFRVMQFVGRFEMLPDVLFVQMGGKEKDHNHPAFDLPNVVDYRGKTTLRESLTLLYNASGLVSGVTYAMPAPLANSLTIRAVSAESFPPM